ncbi:unnamed protein product [Didymodactylos carnosus]|uniref:Glycosyltransferase n=1 Tax=Didymodactylos carnosus TaxID=1234261 RepID=A0A814D5Z7_9BILA|nr:unnamed protein product [Didymodactylos carnosus]CAF0950814.1 unnamed protein product [Didymodactylos carnosus]CAF3557878.1 unnamed protein product [Didymodactylos carnosus]CAF3726501.1 unnamed protein product [Didymodactylos carnosus]
MLPPFTSTSVNYDCVGSKNGNGSTWSWAAGCVAVAAAFIPTTTSRETSEQSNPCLMKNTTSTTNDLNENHKQLVINYDQTEVPTKNGVEHRALRILLFAESFPSFTSGITRRFKEIIRRLAKKGHYIHVITGCKNASTWTDGNDLLHEHVTFSILPSTAFTNKIDCACPFLFPHTKPSICSAIRNYQPDVVHVVEQTPAAMMCGVFAKALNLPIVWSSHTNIDFYLSTYVRSYAVKFARKIYQYIRLKHLVYSSINLTVSQDFADFMEQTGVPSPILVWKTGVDSDLFHPQRKSLTMRQRMFGTKHNYTVDEMNNITLFLCVGRISPEKNFEFLSLVLDRIPSQTFLCIIGDGPFRQTLEPLFPIERVYFFGYLGGEELASAYASADYFIYASISETFGQVYLEAMASGTPVIAAEGGQMKEFFHNGEHGYVWKPGDLDDAEKAVRHAMKERDRLSINARKQALKHSWDNAADQLDNVYYSALIKHNDDHYAAPSTFFLIFRLFYYTIVWFICIGLAIVFMLPFVRVCSPIIKNTTTTAATSTALSSKNRQKNDNNNNEISLSYKNGFRKQTITK